MKTKNGWDVYLKMKQMSNEDGTEKMQFTNDDLIRECQITPEQAREYVKALSLLSFIEFTDAEKKIFVMTDLGKS